MVPTVDHVPDFSRVGNLVIDSVKPLNGAQLKRIALLSGAVTGVPLALATGLGVYSALRVSRNEHRDDLKRLAKLTDAVPTLVEQK
jgi:hypothetical protein